MLTVYGRATSSNVQALLWGMEELGLDTPEFLRMNPHGRIPVLRVGDVALFETAAILRYLAAEHGSDGFWPKDPLRRAQVDMWADWAKTDVAARFTGPVFWAAVRRVPERRDPALIAANTDRLERELAVAERQLKSQSYLCGDAFTLADVMLGHVLYRYFDAGLARREMPALRRYHACLTRRAPYRRCVMVSYEMLKNTK